MALAHTHTHTHSGAMLRWSISAEGVSCVSLTFRSVSIARGREEEEEEGGGVRSQLVCSYSAPFGCSIC